MTASRMWALIVSLIVVGGAIVGGVAYRRAQPDAEMARLAAPQALNPPSPTPTKPMILPGGPETAKTPRDTPAAPQIATPSSEKPEPEQPAPAQPAPEQPALATPVPGETAKRTEPSAGNGEPPHFDIVRVEPKGDAVIAGKGDPNAKVALVEQGKVVAEAKADPNGHFVILPPPLAPGDHDLTLRQSSDGRPGADSQQNVAVSVPRTGKGEVVVALAEPGKPTKVLSAPPIAPPAAPPATIAAAPPPPTPPDAAAPSGPKVALAEPDTAIAPPPAVAPSGPALAIRTAELENGNGFYATGVAAPGTRVAVYLNGSHIADVQAGPDGQWSVTIKRGLQGGHYSVRADALGEGQKVTARVEVPFDVPVAMAAAPAAPDAMAAAPAAPDAMAAAPAAPDAMAAAPAAPDAMAAAPAAPDAPKVASVEPDASAVAPPSAPNPGDIGLVPSPSVSAAPKAGEDDAPAVAPTPRPDIAAAAKAAGHGAPANAPPDGTAAAPAKPADMPPAVPAKAPRVAPPNQAETSVATGTAPSATAGGAPSAGPEAGAAAPGANAVIDQVETALVVTGDNLWNISRAKLGRGMRYTQIYAANASQIRNPRLIYPGQVFVVPRN